MTLFGQNDYTENLMGAMIILFSIVLSESLYFVHKELYKDDKTWLFIPRRYGTGWSINPNFPKGKVSLAPDFIFVVVSNQIFLLNFANKCNY